MPELLVLSSSPARVHERERELCGHHPHWRREPYAGQIWRRDHYRICSYCGSIHPGDMMALLRAGRSRLELSRKPEKRILITPNPIAGREVRMGSIPGPVFSRDHAPIKLRDRLAAAAALEYPAPSIGERLAGHFERPLFEPAPSMILQPFYLDHTSDTQWLEIVAAIRKGESHVTFQSA